MLLCEEEHEKDSQQLRPLLLQSKASTVQEETRSAEKQSGRRNHSTQKVFNEAVGETVSASTANMMEIGCVRVSLARYTNHRRKLFESVSFQRCGNTTRNLKLARRIEIGIVKNFQHA